jgi:hypothetical protein
MNDAIDIAYLNRIKDNLDNPDYKKLLLTVTKEIRYFQIAFRDVSKLSDLELSRLIHKLYGFAKQFRLKRTYTLVESLAASPYELNNETRSALLTALNDVEKMLSYHAANFR